MTAIKLPSPPVPVRGFFGALHRGYIVPITETDLRARDLEVARVMLEAAASACGHLAQADAVAAILHALEVRHHE